MRIAAICLALLVTVTGCMTLHADVPAEVVRQHVAREEGITLASLCSHEGREFSEGASLCMTQRRMVCDPSGRWTKDGDC